MDPNQASAPQPTKSRADMTEEEKRILKEQKKAQKEAAKREKALRKSAAARAAADALSSANALVQHIDYLSIDDEPQSNFGTYRVIQSKCSPQGSGRIFQSLPDLEQKDVGQTVWVRARVHKLVVMAKFAFMTLRRGLDTVQCVLEGKPFLTWAKKNVTPESIVDAFATINRPEGGRVEKCTIGTVELAVTKLYIVSKADEKLPLTLEDAARPETEEETSEHVQTQEAHQNPDASPTRPRVTRETRLDARVVDIRAPPHGSLMRVQGGVCQLFREFLYTNGFMEIHSPKLVAGASESGATVFQLNYFDRKACLAQSPQLYKQMAICGDFHRVFEIGPVFRAEKSSTHRHLCEFTGLDMEMEIYEHYSEILDVLDGLFSFIFDGLEKRYGKELAAVRAKWNVPKFKCSTNGPNLRLKWPEAIAMLREAGVEIGDFEDINSETERFLGKLVKEKYDTDFFMLTHFPSSIRPFYTMVDPNDDRYSNSYDLFMRGEEIVSGAQRIHDVELLKARAFAMLGEDGMDSIKDYVNAFRFGAPPHGGAGVGLERVVMLYLGVGNVRECSLFPRDPQRLTP